MIKFKPPEFELCSAIVEDTKSMSPPWEPQFFRRFSLSDVLLATQNFYDDLIIGQGGFGKVYKGVIRNAVGGVTIAAIKRLDSGSTQGAPEFWAEIEMLSKLRHCHLVSLIGYCDDSNEMILVYEYMPLGTLDHHLHKEVGSPLSWEQRLKICIGAARGLDYLHTGTGTLHGVIHRDVKSSNILLDENWAAKISDFGLSKIGPANQPNTYVNTAIKGTFGYLDPEYFHTGRLTRKSDVYAFGVVLLEVLSGRRAVDTSLEEEQWSLALWAQDYIKEGKLDQLIDTGLKGQILPKCLKEFARIADRCLHSRSKQRPMMGEVVVGLQLALSLQETSIEPVSINTLTRRVQKFFSVGLSNDHLEEKLSRNRKDSNNWALSENILQGTPYPRIFTRDELISATMNFKVSLSAEGCVENVYKGWIDERTFAPTEFGVGMAVVVEKNQNCSKVLQNGKLDLNLLREHRHPNFVNLLGYCLEDKYLFCVYEFMQNGSLEKHLSRKLVPEPLAWVRRLEIAIGAARGLAFLHTRKKVTFNQFKTSLIFLDRDFNAKLDPKVENLDPYPFNTDSYYAAPEWYSFQVAKLDGFDMMPDYSAGCFSVKSEVYSFGVVLLEILTGQKVYDVTRPGGKQNLVKWAIPLLPFRTNLEMLVDPYLNNCYPLEGAFQLGLLILKCLQSMEEKRPSMVQVLKDLEQITAIKIETKYKN